MLKMYRKHDARDRSQQRSVNRPNKYQKWIEHLARREDIRWNKNQLQWRDFGKAFGYQWTGNG